MLRIKGSPLLGLALLAMAPGLLADSSDAGGAVFMMLCLMWFCFMAFLVVIPLIGLYKVFEKAGQPGWHALIPFLSGCVVAHIVGREWWWGLIPILNLIIVFELAQSFGQEAWYGVCLVLLYPIFILMLGFGKAQYQLPPKAPLF